MAKVKVSGEDATPAPATQQELKEESRGIREDFIVIFGLFASLLIFLGVEIQVFKAAPRFSMLVGFSLFLLAAIQSFLLGIYNIVKGKDTFRDYLRSFTAWFIAICFAAAVFCFFWATILRPL